MTLHLGDARQVLASLPDHTADCVVTCPPAYRPDGRPTAGHIGRAETPAAYLGALRQVFAEIYRVLVADGTVWINLRDHRLPSAAGQSATVTVGGSLLGMPWQVASSLRADGWVIRDAIICLSPTASPGDGCFADRYDTLFLLAKQHNHWFTPPRSGEVRHGCRPPSRPNTHCGLWPLPTGRPHDRRNQPDVLPARRQHEASDGSTSGNVWTIPATPSGKRLGAAIPVGTSLRCVAAGCRPGGTVLDPFAATGNVGIAARHLGARFVGSELSPCRCALIACRLNATGCRDLPPDG
ncbi:DNA methyltransferase [Spirillospora sp. NPDC052269]